MSRSTGWQRPAVPPAESTSHPGKNEREHPVGIWVFGAAVGGWRGTTSSPREVTISSIRCAFLLMARRCFIMPSFLRIVQENRGSGRSQCHKYGDRYRSNRESSRSNGDWDARYLITERTLGDDTRPRTGDGHSKCGNRIWC